MKNVIFLKMWNKLWKFCGKSRKFTTNRGTPKNLDKKPSKFTKIRGTFQKKYSKIYSWEIVGNPKKSPKNVKVSFHLLWKYCCLYEHFHVVTQQRNLISLNKDSQNRARPCLALPGPCLAACPCPAVWEIGSMQFEVQSARTNCN